MLHLLLSSLLFLTSCDINLSARPLYDDGGLGTYPVYSPPDIAGQTKVRNNGKVREQMASFERRAVRIEYVCAGPEGFKTGSMGSGVVVRKHHDRTLVATAEHVTDAIEKKGCDIVVKDYRGHSGFGEVVVRNTSKDVSVVEVDEPIGEQAPLYRNPYRGMGVTCVGWPVLPGRRGLDRISVTRGYVATMDVQGYLRITADLYFGNSGGACFSESGKVVGIVSHFMGIPGIPRPVPMPGQYYISDVKYLKNLLDFVP
jgi:hypothetical protein